jgi:hypothetical protein
MHESCYDNLTVGDEIVLKSGYSYMVYDEFIEYGHRYIKIVCSSQSYNERSFFERSFFGREDRRTMSKIIKHKNSHLSQSYAAQ